MDCKICEYATLDGFDKCPECGRKLKPFSSHAVLDDVRADIRKKSFITGDSRVIEVAKVMKILSEHFS
jgi:uncharacterized protein with PIN domain